METAEKYGNVPQQYTSFIMSTAKLHVYEISYQIYFQNCD